MRVEPLVREAFAGVIAEESDRLDRALAAIQALSEKDRLHALRVASGVLYIVLYRMENRQPTAGELADAAADIVKYERSWLQLHQRDVDTILNAHVDLRDLSALNPAEKAASLLFIVTGSLISMCAPREQHWAHFLDQCESMLDAMYGQNAAEEG